MLPHLASRLFGTPLLVHRAKLDVILAVLGERLNLSLPATELAVPLPRAQPAGAPGMAVIPIHGTLVKRTAGLHAASGLTSYTEIGVMLEAALADPQVAGILLDIDSPGGEAAGSFELARAIRTATQVKPVWAVANDSAFSAAYALGAAANRLIVSETGGVGSIGVIALHIDQSVRDANEGYRYTAVTAGAHKNDFTPHQPLSEGARTELQTEVDRLYGLFVEHIAAMRRLEVDQVRATEAGLYFGGNAVSAGLADAVGSLDSTLADFSRYLSTRSRMSPQARELYRTEAATSDKEPDMQDPEVVTDMIGTVSAEASATQIAERVAEQVTEAKREMVQAAQAIAELCLIANVPQQAAEFIAAGKTEAEVRRALIESRAARSDATPIRSVITPEAGTAHPAHPASSPIVQAVQKLIHPE